MLSLVLAVGFLVAIPAGPAAAATTVLNAIDTGWWDDTGFHLYGNSNYLVGDYSETVHNNYFTFDLTTAVPCGTITGATLSAPNPNGGGSPHTYTL
jgi:hypothetical protein